MYRISKISAAPLQEQTLVLNDGTSFSLTIGFVPQQQCWLIKKLVYQTFVLYNLKITSQPNMLYQWQNQLPFGLFCIVVGGREPSIQQDFSSGNAKLYVLGNAEKKRYAEILRNG